MNDNLIRAIMPGIELRAADDDTGMPTMVTTPIVYNRWTTIDSWQEGHFMERIAPGAVKKTFRENRDAIKVLFQHGKDPTVGDKPLGTISDAHDDADGFHAEVTLLDTSYNRDLIPGLEAGLYGASFRFQPVREDLVQSPEPSEDNPAGIPERTITEFRLYEFGPVTWPAYAQASAGLRSLTDEFLFDEIARNPGRARELLATTGAVLLAERDEAPATPDAETRPEAKSHLRPVVRRPARAHTLETKEEQSWRL